MTKERVTTRVVLAPDKFKGSLTAAEVAEALSAGMLAASALSAVDAGAVVAPPPPLQAATNRVAANANAPTRLVDAIVTCDSSN